MRQTIVLLSPDEMDRIDRLLGDLVAEQATLRNDHKQERDMLNAALQRITAEVTEMRDITESAITLLSGVGAELAAIRAQLAEQGVVSAALEALATDLDTQAAELAAAITANSPVAPPPAQ